MQNLSNLKNRNTQVPTCLNKKEQNVQKKYLLCLNSSDRQNIVVNTDALMLQTVVAFSY